MARRRFLTPVISLLIIATVGVWGYLTVRDTVSDGLIMGSQAPALDLPDLTGDLRQLEQFSGTPVMLRFSSRTCTYCSDDFGYLQALQNQYGDSIQIVAVELGAPGDMVQTAVAGRAVDYPVLIDPPGVSAERYRIANIPMLYFIDANGRLTSSATGEPRQIDLAPHVTGAISGQGATGSGALTMNAEVEAIARLVRCQECQGRSIWESMVPSAWDMMEQIEDMVLHGFTRRQVLDQLTEEYGPWILMTPPTKGSGLWAYAMPFIFLASGGLVVQWFLSRRRTRVNDSNQQDVTVDPATEDAVRRRLRDYM